VPGCSASGPRRAWRGSDKLTEPVEAVRKIGGCAGGRIRVWPTGNGICVWRTLESIWTHRFLTQARSNLVESLRASFGCASYRGKGRLDNDAGGEASSNLRLSNNEQPRPSASFEPELPLSKAIGTVHLVTGGVKGQNVPPRQPLGIQPVVFLLP